VARHKYFIVSSLCELFDTVNAQYILGFIRDIWIYGVLVLAASAVTTATTDSPAQ